MILNFIFQSPLVYQAFYLMVKVYLAHFQVVTASELSSDNVTDLTNFSGCMTTIQLFADNITDLTNFSGCVTTIQLSSDNTTDFTKISGFTKDPGDTVSDGLQLLPG